jgi:DNA-binding IclR family transcriptional regulator
LPSAEQRELLDQIRLANGENWAALEPRIMAGLEDHARLGYCTFFGEWHPHPALGFSLRGPRGERYAVSCGGPAYLLPRETMIARVAPRRLETVRQINADIGAASPAD